MRDSTMAYYAIDSFHLTLKENGGLMLEQVVYNSKKWSSPNRRGLSTSILDSSIEIVSTTSDHFYITYNRIDRKFSDRPKVSSIHFSPEEVLHLSVMFSASPGQQVSFVLIEYSGIQRRTHRYSNSDFHHHVGLDTEVMTLAIRVEGVGTVSLGDVKVESHQPLPGWHETVQVDSCESVSLTVNSYALKELPSEAALMTVNFRDSKGQIILPDVDMAINPKIGSYKYISVGVPETPSETTLIVPVPENALSASFELLPWKSDAI